MDHARVTLFAGHYGSGKTNIAVNYALALRREVQRVTIADLDTVNPYFRTKDSERELQAAGVSLICSDYANTNLDMPALPQSLYAILDDTQTSVVVDIGGDDRGAYALGRFAGGILQEHDYVKRDAMIDALTEEEAKVFCKFLLEGLPRKAAPKVRVRTIS